MKPLILAALPALLLTSCFGHRLPPGPDTHTRYLQARSTASALYTSSTSPEGNARTLILFPDGRWELWRATGTALWPSTTGTYQKTAHTLTLTERDTPDHTLHIHRFRDREYLLTPGQRPTPHSLLTDPTILTRIPPAK